MSLTLDTPLWLPLAGIAGHTAVKWKNIGGKEGHIDKDAFAKKLKHQTTLNTVVTEVESASLKTYDFSAPQ